MEYQYKTNINCISSLKITHRLFEDNLIGPIQIMTYNENKLTPAGRSIIGITDTVGDILLRLYNIFKFHTFSTIEYKNEDVSAHHLLNLDDIEEFWRGGFLHDEKESIRCWFKTPISKVLLSFDDIIIVVSYFDKKSDPWQPIITEWLTANL